MLCVPSARRAWAEHHSWEGSNLSSGPYEQTVLRCGEPQPQRLRDSQSPESEKRSPRRHGAIRATSSVRTLRVLLGVCDSLGLWPS